MTDQTIVKIEVNNKFYPISCKIGEEDRVIASGKLLSEIISTLDDKENKISESKILLMAASARWITDTFEDKSLIGINNRLR